ncbi:hypothetical protein D3C72_1695260 [compost metagenome]
MAAVARLVTMPPWARVHMRLRSKARFLMPWPSTRSAWPAKVGVSQARLRSSSSNSEARPTYCGIGVLAGSSGSSAMFRSSISVLPFCMNAGRDQSLLQWSAPAYSAQGWEYSPAMLRKSK